LAWAFTSFILPATGQQKIANDGQQQGEGENGTTSPDHGIPINQPGLCEENNSNQPN
jgi:hypothetical protein